MCTGRLQSRRELHPSRVLSSRGCWGPAHTRWGKLLDLIASQRACLVPASWGSSRHACTSASTQLWVKRGQTGMRDKQMPCTSSPPTPERCIHNSRSFSIACLLQFLHTALVVVVCSSHVTARGEINHTLNMSCHIPGTTVKLLIRTGETASTTFWPGIHSECSCYSALQVVVCSNHVTAQEEINHALTHELIHAYDHCRAADLDWRNCEHHACSEVRAASLSGDCHFKQELFRGNVGIRGQHQNCVRRRAELSVSMNPHCKLPGMAKHAVDKAFEQCFADTAPFDRIP